MAIRVFAIVTSVRDPKYLENFDVIFINLFELTYH
jgi:hypothetical protein